MNVQKMWNNSPLKDLLASIIDNEMWSELLNELRANEVFVFVQDLVKTATTLYKDAVEMIRVTSIKVAEFIVSKYEIVVKEVKALFNVIKEKIGDIKMEQIVAYLEKNYAQMMKEITSQLESLSKQVKAASDQYIKDLKSLVKTYTEQLMVVYKDIQTQLTTMYKTYRPIIAQEYNRMVTLVTKVYTQLAQRTLEDFKMVSKQIISMATTLSELTTKLRNDLIEMWNKSDIRAQMIALKKMTIAETIEVVQKIPENARVYAEKAITQITAIVKRISKEVLQLMEKIIKDLVKQLDATFVELMSNMKTTMSRCVEVVRVVAKDAVDLYEPFVEKCNKAYQDMDREMKETIAFMYKYYNLQPKIDKLTIMIEARVNEIAAQGRLVVERLRKQLDQIPAMVDGLMKEYSVKVTQQLKEMKAKAEDILVSVEKMLPKISPEMMKKYLAKVEGYIREAMKRVQVLTKDGVEFTSDIVLRGVHQSLKKVAVMEKSMRETFESIRKNVRINMDAKGLIIDISHIEITPSFKALLNTTKSLAIKTLRQTIQQIEFTIRQAQIDVMMLRMAVEEYVKMAPAMIEKATKVIQDETAAIKAMIEKFIEELQEKWNKEYPVLVAKLTKIVGDLKKKMIALNDMVVKNVPVIMAEVQKMIENQLARIVKLKDFTVAMIEKTSQTISSMLERISKSKIYIKFVAQVEQKLTALKKAIMEKIRAIQNNPTFIKVVDDIQKLIETTLTNMKLNAEKFVKVATKQAVALKKALIKYAEIIKKESPVVLAKIMKFTKAQIDDITKIISSFPEKLKELTRKIIKAVQEFVDKITKSKEFVQIVDYIKKQVADIKTMIQKAIEDIKNNPTLITIRKKLTEMTMKLIKALKEKSAILVQEIQKRIAIVKAEVEKLIQIIKKDGPVIVEKAIKFIKEQWAKFNVTIKTFVGDLEKLVKEISTKVIDFGKRIIKELTKLIEDKIAELKKNPQLVKIINETKNVTMAIVTEIKTKIPEIAKTLEEKIALIERKVAEYVKIVKEKAPVIFKQISAMIKETVTKIETMVKSTITDIEKKIMDLYKGIISSKSFKDAVAFMKKQLAAIKDTIEKQLEMMKQQIEMLMKNPTDRDA